MRTASDLSRAYRRLYEVNPYAPRKKQLKKLSAEVVCWKKLPNITDELSIEANSMDPEQTAPI